MDERLHAILSRIGAGEIAEIAAAVLGVAVARSSAVTLAEIVKPHADARTIGIVRVSGTARCGTDASERSWSVVTKIIDAAIPAHWKDAVSPNTEVLVYEHRLFADLGLNLRPARCYHISRPDEWVTILWLEDLTGANGAPFEIADLAPMARHLGEWNATMAADPPALPFSVGHDFQVRSWNGWDYPERAEALLEMDQDPMARAMYAHHPFALAGEFAASLGQLVECSKTLPHALGLADCPVSNFFYRPGETIAIDWAGLGNEPLGADGGRFIGSALTFGRKFASVAECERELFESYAAGLAERGYDGSHAELRSAYLSELGFYLANMAVFPTVLSGARARLSREFFERRFQWPMEELGGEAARVIDLLPSYVTEIRQLLEQI